MPQKIKTFKLFIFFVGAVLLSTLNAVAESTSSLKSIPAKIAFETRIESPNHLAFCNHTIWTFSESIQKIISLDPQTGKIKNYFSLTGSTIQEKPIDTAALACQNDRLFILVNSKKQGHIFEVQTTTTDSLKIVNQFNLPQKSRATDLFCNLKKCWLLQDKPFVTDDLKKWITIDIASAHSLKKANAHPELDPFEDWQSTLIIAKSGYTKGSVNSYNQAVFLDTARTQAIVQKGTDWTKWGSFGAWEGSFLSPKAITFISEDKLAIADSKLKVISLFTFDGIYQGVLTLAADSIFSPEYTLGLVSEQNRLYVADFGANKIIALDIEQFKASTDEATTLHLRKNLFRREEVLKDPASSLCLKCHDGAVSNQLYKYIKMHFHHPLECSQCHDPHHAVKENHFLRMPQQALCESCHKEYTNTKTNHVWQNRNINSHSKKGGLCADCHRSHADSEKLLIENKPQLCLNCHKDKTHSHNSIEILSDLEKSKAVFTNHGEMVCQTCHQTHINWKETHFVKPPQPILNLCSSCHGDKADRLFKDFHKIMKTKKSNK